MNVIKTVNLIYQNESSSKDVMFIFEKSYLQQCLNIQERELQV